MAQRFGKAEKLKSRKWIEQIFTEGKSIKAYPVLAVYRSFEEQNQVKIKAGFSVSKRKFRKAVDRNLLKRRMREAYRLNKAKLDVLAESGKTIGVMFIYMPGKSLSFEEINKAFLRLAEEFTNVKA
ncbi:MAG: ribonuclease P protein component [Owenweeksia sp.]